MKKKIIAGAIGALMALGTGSAIAAAPDWGKVEGKDITLFYPGVSPLEWIQKGTEHGGARALKKGETCADCHSDEAADMGKKIATGQKLEPNPIPGKAPAIPVKVQAAHDGENLYLRFSWKQPAASGAPKMDAANPVKIAFMLESGGKVELADQSGCWATCHQDSRTMPGADDAKKKYVKGGSLAEGKFYDLYQWRSGENKGFNGHVADTRVMEGGAALVSAEGKQDGDAWSVVFTRKLAGGEGDVTLESGKSYNFGFAIHNDSAAGRYHHVSLGYKLGVDADGDVKAAKQ
ncbi:MAG: ethylbenzene dehydrogenase-related protein [Pseudomonadaceae bacterium]